MFIRFSEETVRDLSYYSGSKTTKAVIPKSLIVKTDVNGTATVDLYRGGEYAVYLEGYENLSRRILVPDSTTAPLPDVIFPVISQVEYTHNGSILTPVSSPTLSLSLSGTSTATLSVETVHRSGLRISGLEEVTVASSNESILTVELTSGSIVLKAVAQGTAQVQVTKVEPESGKGTIIAPDPGILGSLAVTVGT